MERSNLLDEYHNLKDENETLRAENERLRAALKIIVAGKPVTLDDGREWKMTAIDCARIAKQALEGGER